MKVLKIGRSSTNDIVIGDVTVSSQHAIITVLDTKEVRIKDLNSTNGTYVNGRRITTETAITASDVIKVGNSTIDWVKYLSEKKKPSPPAFSGDVSAIKRRKTIGRNAGDIVLNHNDVSSNHAQLIEKVNGDIVIADCGSTNGTYVNGQKISMQSLRAGDRVLIANKYPLDWQHIFDVQPPKPAPKKHLKTVLISTAAAAAVIIGLVLWQFNKPMTKEEINARYEKSVVMIYVQYTYQVSSGDQLIGNYVLTDDGEIREGTIGSSGTGFFISDDGKIMTNRHVAVIDNQSGEIKAILQNQLERAARETGNRQYSTMARRLEVALQTLQYGIIPNNTYVSGTRDIVPCHFVKTAGNEHIDLAMIKTNMTPTFEINVVDLSKAVVSNADIVVGNSMYTLGFPGGFQISNTREGIKSVGGAGEISQSGDEYSFMFSANSWHGASGSPIFNNKGQLIGVVYAGQDVTQGYNEAIRAKHAVDLAK